MKQKRIKWAILGTSFISEIMAQAIQQSENGELYAIASRSLSNATLFANKFSIPKAYETYQAVLNDSSIEAVYIGLPNHLHKEWIIRCAQAKKHILAEKPFVLNLTEVREVWDIIKKSDVYCLEALMYRFHPFNEKIRSVIDSIGEIRLINALYTADIASKANPVAGGAIRNLGCYPVSLVRSLLGEPDEMLALGRQNPETEHDNQASLLLKFPKEGIAVISTADDLAMQWQFDIYGSEGQIKIESNPWLPEQDNNKMHLNIKGKTKTFNVKANKPLYSYQIDVLSQQILEPQSDFNQQSMLDVFGNISIIQSWYEMYNFSELYPSRARKQAHR